MNREWLSVNSVAARLEYSRQELEDIAGRAASEYRSRDFKAPGKEKWRHLDDPSPHLKRLQRRILRRILNAVEIPPHICGGVRYRSTRDAAAVHVGAPCVAKVDISDCFGSIGHDRVFTALRKRAGCSTDVAGLLTRLTTLNHHLPQGAPTSPALANLVLLDVYDDISIIAKEYDLAFSFYVDDIAISGIRAREGLEPVIRALSKQGLKVGRKKTTVMPASRAQSILGIVVNARVGVAREGERGLRVSREAIRRDILFAAKSDSLTDEDLKGIRGKIAYVRFVAPEQGERLQRLADSVLPKWAPPGVGREKEYRPCQCRK